MWLADRWKDYEVIDCSCGEKLERWSKYILLRPDPQVIWDTPKTNKNWKKLNGHYHRSKKGGGEWEFFDLPQEWTINYSLPINKELTFHLKPFSFKHTGLFPEQAANWDWFSKKIYDAKKSGRDVKVLNLFAYTGGATLAAAAAGAAVTHVDASKGMVTWAKENAVSSGLGDAPIRWLVDDCEKFGSEISIITPCWLKEEDADEYEQDMKVVEKLYFKWLEKGYKAEEARAFLPFGLKTEIVMTGFVDAWEHFFELRSDKHAHSQARELSIPLEEYFKENKYL